MRGPERSAAWGGLVSVAHGVAAQGHVHEADHAGIAARCGYWALA